MTTAFVKGLLLCQWDCCKIELDFFSSRTYDEHKGYMQGTIFNYDIERIIFKVHPSGLYNTPADLTCLEDCPDVCVQNRVKWVLFWPQGREWRASLNGCQISQAPLYGYILPIHSFNI